MFFNKKESAVKVTPHVAIEKAKDISDAYLQLSKCCSLISDVSNQESLWGYSQHTGGWKVSSYCLKGAGIDIDEVYNVIKKMAQDKKTQLELELINMER